jgi:hypothetical protein
MRKSAATRTRIAADDWSTLLFQRLERLLVHRQVDLLILRYRDCPPGSTMPVAGDIEPETCLRGVPCDFFVTVTARVAGCKLHHIRRRNADCLHRDFLRITASGSVGSLPGGASSEVSTWPRSMTMITKSERFRAVRPLPGAISSRQELPPASVRRFCRRREQP